MPKDYLIDRETGTLKKYNGDFVIGDSTKQHQRSLLMAQKGEIKQHLLTGVGIANYLDDENPDDMLREVRIQMVQDGQTVKNLVVTETGIAIDGSYSY